MKKVLFSIVLLTYSLLAYTQDIIIKTNGKKVYCKVTKVDSSHVYYDQKEGIFINSINRKDVQEIHYGNQIPKSRKSGTLPQNSELYYSGIYDQTGYENFSHHHYGLYLSLSAGPLFGKITDKFDTYTLEMSGTGAIFDFKIGGAVSENLIFHGTLISAVLPGPKIINIHNGVSIKASDNLNIGEAMFGGGLTYYIMPSNAFLSGSVGLGNFSIIDNNDKKNNVSTQYGFSMQLKIGKEWFISKKWGMGIAITYMKTNLTNKPDNSTVEKLDSNRFGVLLNTTFN